MQMLKRIKDQQSNASEYSLNDNNIENQKVQLKMEFEKFRDLSKQEVSRLERQRTEIDDAISSVKLELNSESNGGFGTPNMMKQS